MAVHSLVKIDIAWDESRTAFDADGSFRDIYVLETTRDDWTRALAYLGTAHAEMTLDDKPVAGALDFETGRGHCLTFSVGRVALNCHFFSEREIEFDFDPRDLTRVDVQALAEFMADLGLRLEKVVVLTTENVSVDPIYRFNPRTRTLAYIPPD